MNYEMSQNSFFLKRNKFYLIVNHTISFYHKSQGSYHQLLNLKKAVLPGKSNQNKKTEKNRRKLKVEGMQQFEDVILILIFQILFITVGL